MKYKPPSTRVPKQLEQKLQGDVEEKVGVSETLSLAK
jgi:hypothetical protein